jgi:hypothetical protein
VTAGTGEQLVSTGGAISGGLWLATALILVPRVRYPRWWFDFARELTRFGARVGAYFALLADGYPSTVDEQSVDRGFRRRTISAIAPSATNSRLIVALMGADAAPPVVNSGSSGRGPRSTGAGAPEMGSSATWGEPGG